MSDERNNPENPLFHELEETFKKLHLEKPDWMRGVSPEEILYLLNQCPFLQIVSMGNATSFDEPQFILSKSGWKIHYYGDAMSSSPGELLFKSADFRELFNKNIPVAEKEGVEKNEGKGTMVKQAFDTAADMIAFAEEAGWSGVRIVDGHPLMIWAAWMAAEDLAFPLDGYTPTEADRQRRERVKRSSVEDQLHFDFKLRK